MLKNNKLFGWAVLATLWYVGLGLADLLNYHVSLWSLNNQGTGAGIMPVGYFLFGCLTMAAAHCLGVHQMIGNHKHSTNGGQDNA